MGIVGLTSMVSLFSSPLGNIFRYEISTIRSLATLVPVVSRSKKIRGFFRFSSIKQILICSKDMKKGCPNRPGGLSKQPFIFLNRDYL